MRRNDRSSADRKPAAEQSRELLADAQARLVQALVLGTPAPLGFDASRLAVEAEILAAKREALVRHAQRKHRGRRAAASQFEPPAGATGNAR
jgi:hypothetical protein